MESVSEQNDTKKLSFPYLRPSQTKSKREQALKYLKTNGEAYYMKYG